MEIAVLIFNLTQNMKTLDFQESNIMIGEQRSV